MKRFAEGVEILIGEIAAVLPVHVVGHEVDDDFHAGFMGTPDQGFEFRHAVVDVDGQGRIDVEPVADGVGRACFALDEGRVVVGDGAEMGPGGMRDHAGVPHGTDRQFLEPEQFFLVDIVELAGPVSGIRASGNAVAVPEGPQ